VAPQYRDGEDLVLHSGCSKFWWPPEDEGERRASRELRLRSQAVTTPPSTRAAAAPWGRAGFGFRGRRRGRPQDGHGAGVPLCLPSSFPSSSHSSRGGQGLIPHGGGGQGDEDGVRAFIGNRLGFGAPYERRGSSASVPRGTRRTSGGGGDSHGAARRPAPRRASCRSQDGRQGGKERWGKG
jgi:hypothetical protein